MNRTTRIAVLACATAAIACTLPGCIIVAHDDDSDGATSFSALDDNRELVRSAFERWKAGGTGPFELLADDAEWTIAGSSPLSKIYSSKKQFMDEVITPFNARLSSPLVPTVRRIYADGDTVIVRFDAAATAKDGVPYRNTYSWFLEMEHAQIVRATAFFDTRTFDELWTRVTPAP